MEKEFSNFVISTAKEYDMDQETVQREYEKFGCSQEFYNSLESILKDRRHL